jgi:anti-sigma B factor antagonist/stage II sporulation protein AA (anti-sigma F factor antagonist)
VIAARGSASGRTRGIDGESNWIYAHPEVKGATMEAVFGFPPTRLRVRQNPDREGCVRVILTGEIDMSNVDTLAEALAAAPATAHSLVVDLADVTFLDSTGIAALLSAHRRAGASGRTLTVVNAQGMVRRVLDITGVYPALTGKDMRPARPL